MRFTLRVLFSILLILFIPFSTQGETDETDPKQYFINQQYGANQGVYSVGLGYRLKHFEPTFGIGYSPAVLHAQAIVQYNLRFNWLLLKHPTKPKHFEWLLGFSTLFTGNANTYFKVPKPYPNKYYPPNAFFFALQSSIRHHNVFVELSIIDYYFEVLARNQFGSMRAGDVISLGVGINTEIDIDWKKMASYFTLEY